MVIAQRAGITLVHLRVQEKLSQVGQHILGLRKLNAYFSPRLYVVAAVPVSWLSRFAAEIDNGRQRDSTILEDMGSLSISHECCRSAIREPPTDGG